MEFDYAEILEFDDQFHEKFGELGDKFIPILGASKYSVTGKTLIGLMASANSVKLGIYDLAEACDTHLYVLKVLHRTLIEHYLKFHYILLRALKEQSDDVGLEYRKYSTISETLAFINASEASMKIAGKPIDAQVLKKLRKDHPDLNISKRDLNEITYKWKHRSIIKYIKANSSFIKNESAYLLKLIPEYAELSSFIHGGTFAEEYYHEVFSEGKLREQMYYEVSEAAMMAATMKVHLMILVVTIDDTFQQGLEDLMSIIMSSASETHNKKRQDDA
ncbi:hypothetical protein [Marinomonas sp. TW1]|uniref:hypothetical protein n=1 Tax=Marinomonas sp. TW1 TaxID=1561203 RepID=UPI000ADD2D3F|nr:hypothetical protein [Marinomonas sp. TW1]